MTAFPLTLLALAVLLIATGAALLWVGRKQDDKWARRVEARRDATPPHETGPRSLAGQEIADEHGRPW